VFSWGCSSVGEHLLCKQGVVGSIPSTSINASNERTPSRWDYVSREH
jgi:hypothetical protein